MLWLTYKYLVLTRPYYKQTAMKPVTFARHKHTNTNIHTHTHTHTHTLQNDCNHSCVATNGCGQHTVSWLSVLELKIASDNSVYFFKPKRTIAMGPTQPPLQLTF